MGGDSGDVYVATAVFDIAQTVEAATGWPRPTSSP